MSSQEQRILTIEEEKAAEFGKRLDVEVNDRLAGASSTDDEVQAAFAEAAGHTSSKTAACLNSFPAR